MIIILKEVQLKLLFIINTYSEIHKKKKQYILYKLKRKENVLIKIGSITIH